MKILLTGGTGFLGSHLVHGLLKSGHEAVVLKRPNSDTWRLNDIINQIQIYTVSDLEKIFKENCIDAVIHTACNYGRNNESITSIVATNLLFGLEVVECAIKNNVVLFLNTDTLLERNLNSYSLSKKQFVEWLKKISDQIQVVNMKLEHMYGPKDDETKFIPWVISQLRQNVEEISLTEGMQKRDFVYISDVVNSFLTVLGQKTSLGAFSEFDVGSGELVNVKDFITELASGFKRIHNDNTTILNFGARPYRNGEMMTVDVDISALEAIGWKAKMSRKEGVDALLEGIEE